MLALSEYLTEVQSWCDEALQAINNSIEDDDKRNERDELESFRERLLAFRDSLSRNTLSLAEDEIYKQAVEIYDEFCARFAVVSEDEGNRSEDGKNQGEDEVSRGWINQRIVPIGRHQLPPLPYAYNALEPYIDEETMRLHHDKHHKSYVDGLNKAELEMQKARQTGNFDLIKHWEREAAFNGAGHYLHTIFWSVMSPNGGGKPQGSLLTAINQSFGSFDKFKQHFSEAANKVEGGGWAILVWSPRSGRLEILQAEKHQNLSQWDVIPLLVLDVWEHAYYLKYKNDRKKYIDNWWNVVNWPEVSKRFNEAQKVRWTPY